MISKWFKFGSVCLGIMFLAVACNPPVANKRDFTEALLLTESGRTIRGSVMGLGPNDVLEKEVMEPIHQSDTLLIFDGDIHYDKRSVHTTVYYSFDSYGLFEIQFDILPQSAADAELVFRALRNKLTMIYGRPDQDGIALRFSTFSPSNNVVEITLSDESMDSGEPFISLNFLEPLDDEI